MKRERKYHRMKSYYIESIINQMALAIQDLITKQAITNSDKIILYGMDTLSFGMKTILANEGYEIEGYITDNEILCMQMRRRLKASVSRYVRTSRDMVFIGSVKERLIPFDPEVKVLIADRNYEIIRNELILLGYEENRHFYCVYDQKKDDFADLVANRKKLTVREIQEDIKPLLKMVDDFCNENRIRYWVCGGTMLGTIRHKGFIPWDDDVDIFMPWQDYQRFVREFKDNERYELIGPDKCDRKDYFELFSKLIDKKTIVREKSAHVNKIHPIAVDIFPLIGLPDKSEERKLFFAQYYEMEKAIWEDFYKHNGDVSVYNEWYPRQKAFLEKYDFDRADYVGVLATAYQDRDCTTRQVYSETLRMPFEDMEVNVPVGYKEYLDNLYGSNWMELPEESKRNSHHHMEAYWL